MKFLEISNEFPGSSSGIGRETALVLASRGASVTVHGRNGEKLKVSEEIIVEPVAPKDSERKREKGKSP